MRYIYRIDEILTELKILWDFFPDQRFLQLLENYVFPEYVVREQKYREMNVYIKDLFFIEDDVILKKLKELNRRLMKEQMKDVKH